MHQLLIILGPTATGKTDLALDLARQFGGELIACDSRQVYRGLDIGTGKSPSDSTYEVRRTGPRRSWCRSWWEIGGIKIWMYDVVSPKGQYTVADYVKDAGRVADQVISRGQLPIIVGGTGLYLKALLEGLPSLAVPVDEKLRGELTKLTVSQLQQRLKMVSPTRWRQMNQSDRANKRRLIRAIEVVVLSETKDIIPRLDSSLITQNDKRKNQNNILKIGLTAPRTVLYERIDTRVISRIDQGMIEEAQSLHRAGLTFKRMKELGLEYGVLAEHLQTKLSRQQLIDKLKTKIHQYAKRQLTWFKREQGVNWFDITCQNWQSKVEKLVSDWYNA